MKALRHLAAVVLALLLYPVLGRAEIMVGESLEWLVDSSDAIGVYKAVGVEPGKKGKSWAYSRVRGQLARKLKGNAPKKVSFRYYAQGTKDSPPKKLGKADKFLVFFPRAKKEDKEVKTRYTICLSAPNVRGFRSIAFTKDFRVLKREEDILKVVGRRVKLKKSPGLASPEKAANVFTPPSGFLRVEIPYDKEAFRALWAGSVCYLVVPADEEFKHQLLREVKSRDVWTRARAASRLTAYPGKDTVKLLRSLLADKGTAKITSYDRSKKKTTVTVYPVRQAAYEALKRLGEKVEKPKGLKQTAPEAFLF